MVIKNNQIKKKLANFSILNVKNAMITKKKSNIFNLKIIK